MKTKNLYLLIILCLIWPAVTTASDHLYAGLDESIQELVELSELSLEIEQLLLDVYDIMELRLNKLTIKEHDGLSEQPTVVESVNEPLVESEQTNESLSVETHKEKQKFHVNNVSFTMFLIPAAEFPHGNLDHPAQVYKDYWLAETEVTYVLWHQIRVWAENNGYVLMPAKEGSKAAEFGSLPSENSNQPAVNMPWGDALAWCNALSEYFDLTPIYHYSGGVIRDSGAFYTADETALAVTGSGFRLPTELEWHLAARFAGSEPFAESIAMGGYRWLPRNWASGAHGDITDSNAVFEVAWVAENSDQTMPVGLLQPNALGIYDMTGNASEWIFQQYGHIAASRGGSYYHDLRMVGVGDISHNYPYYNRYPWVGFRIARSAVR